MEFFTLRGDWIPTLGGVIPKVCEVCRRHPNIRYAGVFGSVARGDARPDSDVDVFAVFEPEADKGMVLDLEGELSEELQKPVDVLSTLDGTTELFRRSFERDAVLAYERA